MFFQFQNSGAYTVQTILATNGQSLQAIIPIVRQGEHIGQQALCLQGQLLVLKMVVAHDGIVDVFVDAECGHGGFPFSPVCGQKKTQRPRLSGNAAFRQGSLL